LDEDCFLLFPLFLALSAGCRVDKNLRRFVLGLLEEDEHALLPALANLAYFESSSGLFKID
jgi:hypothetical protein